jgi:hypothetical protein
MLRFTILEHESPRGRHWDLLLEAGAVLTTWALASPPDATGPIDAESLADHRIEYLDYEGPISGDRGTVSRWDAGVYRLVRQTDRELVLALEGRRLVGTATLTRSADDPRRWRFEMSQSRKGKG